MKKGVFYISILLPIILFATSCCPSEKYYHIKDKDKLSFKENDMFIYKSNLGNYDTLFVEQINDTIQYHNTSEAILCDTKFYEEHIYYYFNNLYKPFEKDERPVFYLSYDSDMEEISFYVRCIPYYSGLKEQLFFPKTYYLGDSTYYYVSYYYCYNCTDSTYFNKYAYNRKNGIIFYGYPNGEEFSLFKYIPAK